MHDLLKDKSGKKMLLLGNEGIVRGALEAGIEVATAYPGTPSSEIADTFHELSKESSLYFQYSTNEKVALEVASGAAIAGMRTMCTMKHVGLNVAADPLNTLSYTGVKAGMVIVTADDPAMHSSQNEQDNRYYAKLALLPMIEPSDPAEAKELTRIAFELSEELELPVLLRTTTRVNHTRGVCEFGPLIPRRFNGHFDKNPMRWVPVPAVARQRRPVLLAKQKQAYEAMTKLGIDKLDGSGDMGIIASGVAYAYVKELIEELGVADKVQLLKITSINPLPEGLIQKVLGSCKKVLVVEELEPIIETDVRAIAQRMNAKTEIMGKGEGLIPRMFELSADAVRPAMGKLLGIEIKEVPTVELPVLPPRPPMLCAGCSHRSTYYAVKSIADDDTYYSSDIGCYTLGLNPPLSVTDSFLCMGSSVTMACGVSIENKQKHVAFIGDSTFFHSGINGLVNAVYNGHDLLLVILDNSTTAMTGHQPHPGQVSENVKHTLDVQTVVKSLGVENVHVTDPEDLKETMEILAKAYDQKGVRVIISKRPCVLYAGRLKGARKDLAPYTVDQDKCKYCGKNQTHEPCGVPIFADDEIQRAKIKLASSNIESHTFPAAGNARKPATAPCTWACPSNICIYGYMSLVRAGRYKEALAMIREQVPLPLSLGRVCHHPCEDSCIRGDYDDSVAINETKRFLAERETEQERKEYIDSIRAKAVEAQKRTGGKKVAVIGAGPAGITAAYDLNVRGYNVTVFEREDSPGGLLVTGIPSYRMPRELLKKELDGVFSTGIDLQTGKTLGKDIKVSGLLEDYDAVCLSVGANKGRKLELEGEDSQGVEDALAYLRRVYLLGEKEQHGKVVVVGGGDAAIDAARTALRMGANDVSILYRRSVDEMPASRVEINAAVAEGIKITYQAMPTGFQVSDGKVTGVACVRTEMVEPDKGGRRRPVVVEGSDFTVEADKVIAAIGQVTDESLLDGDVELKRGSSGWIISGENNGATSNAKVFAAGDATGEGWTVIAAIAQGKKAAFGIDEMLSGEAVDPVELHTIKELEGTTRYHPPVVEEKAREFSNERSPKECIGDFDEISDGFNAEKARLEAQRCLSCGQCARCNNCLDNFGCPAIYKEDGKIYIDEVLCVGCGVCAQICPNDAIVPVRADS